MSLDKILRVVTAVALFAALEASSASAITFTGTFSDPLLPSLYPGSTLTGNFSFDFESIGKYGWVPSNKITFSLLRTFNQSEGWNGSGWSFATLSFWGNSTSFVFDTRNNLFVGPYAIERHCLPGEGCPPGSLGQLIFSPVPIGESVAWDRAPNQTVVITTNTEKPVPEPSSWLGLLVIAVICAGFRLKHSLVAHNSWVDIHTK